MTKKKKLSLIDLEAALLADPAVRAVLPDDPAYRDDEASRRRLIDRYLAERDKPPAKAVLITAPLPQVMSPEPRAWWSWLPRCLRALLPTQVTSFIAVNHETKPKTGSYAV